jgi:hypothetical protein
MGLSLPILVVVVYCTVCAMPDAGGKRKVKGSSRGASEAGRVSLRFIHPKDPKGRTVRVHIGMTPGGSLSTAPLGHAIDDEKQLRDLMRKDISRRGEVHYILLGALEEDKTSLATLTKVLNRLKAAAHRKRKTVIYVLLKKLSP